ncbi:cardiolipin synthetase [Streptococcus infantis]|uniref:Cardiolipin synthase n=2 Tax=root TaxID=1 RepID=A0A0F2E6H7_9STRE|nr:MULTISPECIES: cardiolipin synthase [Streptococcus]KJQ78004.1 cardiolipin synthetase [Streptococcus infantis]MCP9016346.1 cardiolipin synthase [Streptococcus sp. CF8_St5-17]QLF56218.1 cardiolipin synthase [Streptococcus sp. oral taxon 061]
MGTRKFRLLMSKYGFSIAIILIELFVIFGIILYMSQIAPLVWVSLVFLVSVATVIAIVNRSMSPESKVTWLIVTFVPVFGPLLYLMFGERRLSKKELKQLQELNSIAFHENNGRQLHLQLQETDKSAYGIINALLHMDSNAEVYDQTDSQFFASGEEMWQQMLKDLKRAEKFIFLEYYIVEEGLMWDSMLEILEEKAAQGVEVKMLYDDIGCMVTLPGDYTVYLRSKGIDAHKFNKVIPRMTVAYNNRDHRKILVIDGQISYTGGINLADEYINHIERFGHWKDSGIRIDGPATQAFTRLFLMNWYINRGEISDFDQYHLENQTRSGSGLCIPYGSGPKPIYQMKVGKIVYQNLINQAEDFVYITTPYLIIDYDLTEDIKNAAMRGVDVRIVTPHIPDKKLIQLVTRGAYPDLLSAGVRIFEYTPGFIHSKQMIVDDRFAAVGTINLDYRSLVHHYENAVLLYKTESIADIRKDFEEIFEQSQEIFSDTINPTWYQMMIKEVTQLFAPML